MTVNDRVQALIDGHALIDGAWTEADFLALALAALDQGGMSAKDQQRVIAMLSAKAMEAG